MFMSEMIKESKQSGCSVVIRSTRSEAFNMNVVLLPERERPRDQNLI